MEIDDQETADKPNDSQTTGEGNQWPPWVKPLLEARFFRQCGTHTENECNLYCVDCYGAGALCPDCILPEHQDHKLIPVWRSPMKIPVIEAGDLDYTEERLDITGVLQRDGSIYLSKWPYPQSRAPIGATSTPCCRVCHRYILASYQFCCLSCKFEGTPPPPPAGAAKKRGAAEVPWRGCKRRKCVPHRSPLA